MFAVHGKRRRVLRAADQEPAGGASAAPVSTSNRVERRLPVLGVGAEVGEVGAVPVDRCHGTVHVGVDAAVERRHRARAEPLAQLVESPAPGVAQHEIEVDARPRGPMYGTAFPDRSRSRVTGVSRS